VNSVALRAHPLVFGVVVFLASESMLFAGLLAAWFDLRGLNTTWMPVGTEIDLGLATFGTVLLGAGSVTMGIAQVAAARRRRELARAMLVLTLFCALGFVYTALRDWSLANFNVASSAYGTLFFVLTGTHLAHVIVGAVLLLALTIFLGEPAFTRDRSAGVEAIAYYWHFVFVIWLAVYATIYLIR
jgi:heme/copper-type cytochrome/quinol oxidase subunit 3